MLTFDADEAAAALVEDDEGVAAGFFVEIVGADFARLF